MLEGQLGAKPSPALERARRALGSGRSADVDTHPRVVIAPPAVPAAPLVGRASELREIVAAVAAAVDGKSREIVWITGEPGIGKTRLLEEAAYRVRSANGAVLAGRAYEAEMVRPFGPWIDALRSAAPAVTDEALAAELAPLLPELGAHTPGGDRHRLFEAVARLLDRMTNGGRPVGLSPDRVRGPVHRVD